MTYSSNIERLTRNLGSLQKQTARNTSDRINFIQDETKESIDNINKFTDLVVGGQTSPGIIPTFHGEYVERETKKGLEAQKLDRLDKVRELEERLGQIQDMDYAHLDVKEKLLLNGAYYEDADRYAKLSPHAQVAYARQKLGLYKDSLQSKLKYKMAKSEDPFNIEGLNGSVTAAQIHNDPLVPPVVKEVLVDRMLTELRLENGINGFSKELLELEGIDDFIDERTGQLTDGVESTAKKAIMKHYRTQYNVRASQIERDKRWGTFINGEQDLNLLLKGYANTLDNNEQRLGYPGAWKAISRYIINGLITGTISEDDVRKWFKQPNFQHNGTKLEGKDFNYLHYGKMIDMFTTAASYKQNEDRATKALKDAKAQNFLLNELPSLFEPGGEIANIIEEKGIDKMDNAKRAKEMEGFFDMLNQRYIDLGGTVQNGQWAPEINDLYYTHVHTNQDELLSNAIEALTLGQPINSSHTAYMSASTQQKLFNHPLYPNNNINIKENGINARKQGLDGGLGSRPFAAEVVEAAFEANSLEMLPTWKQSHLNQANAIFDNAFREFLVKAGPDDPNRYINAEKYARAILGWTYGLQDHPDGKSGTRKRTEVEPLLTKFRNEEIPLGDANKQLFNRAINLKDWLVLQHDEFGDGGSYKPSQQLLNSYQFIPSLGLNSPEFKQLVRHAKGENVPIPAIYHEIANRTPGYTVSDIVRWQLRNVNMTLSSNSAIEEVLKMTEEVDALARKLGYKTLSTDVQQVKIDVVDGSKFSLLPVRPTTEWEGLEKYDVKGKRILEEGDDVEGVTGASSKGLSLNEMYIQKGFHENDPGPQPKKEDFPIQPGDEIVPANFGYYTGPLSMDSVKYDMAAYQEALADWQEQNNTYRPLTRKTTRGSRKKYQAIEYFNPETGEYQLKQPGVEEEITKLTGRQKQQQARELASKNNRLEIAESLPDSKVVNLHRTEEGRYIRGPITVYKHVDQNGYVKWKIAPPGSESYLQSFWNIPGSPVLSPALQDYAMELYNQTLQTA